MAYFREDLLLEFFGIFTHITDVLCPPRIIKFYKGKLRKSDRAQCNNCVKKRKIPTRLAGLP